MTAVHHSTSTQPQPTQNTAPIIEFSCLYTHDVRRKAKRWQDGLLRYHTFNRRVMVYDLARNFIGDSFNQTGVDLQEGDELELEKHFALVEVSHQTAVVQQDITELNKSRQRKEPKQTARHTPITPRIISSPAFQTQRTPIQVPHKHRSLEAMLGGARRPLGKAVIPTESPFEQRQTLNAFRDERPPKKLRIEASRSAAPAQAQGPVIDLSSSPMKSPAKRPTSPPKPLEPTKQRPPLPRQDVRSERTMTMSDDAKDASENRRPLKVISNAPRKMLLCRQPTNRKSSAPTTTDINTSGPPAESRPLVLDPQQIRLQERLARIGQRRRQSVELEQSPPPEQRTPLPRGARQVQAGQPRAEAFEEAANGHDRQSRGISHDCDTHSVILIKNPSPIVVQEQQPVKESATSVPNTTTSHQEAPIGLIAAPDHRPPLAQKRRVIQRDANAVIPMTLPVPKLAPPPNPVDPLDFGPWSREAQDLFDWWPPDRDKSGHKIPNMNKDISTK